MRATYRGPGDHVELDGLTVKKGEAIELTSDQVARIRADSSAIVDVETTTPETPVERSRILAKQADGRVQAGIDAENARQDQLDEIQRLDAETARKAQDAAAEQQRVATEREAARREAAAGGGKA